LLVPARRELRGRQANRVYPEIPAAQANRVYPEIPAAQAIQDYQAFPALTALLVPWALRVSKGPKVSKDLLERTELPERPAPPSQWLSRCPPVKLRKDGPGSTSPVRAGRTMRP
tara:strand:+ start:79 stop:420 length:342 start_codon:yes stop_codon:yes gene_type:complete